ncbi:MAG: hypothetical protein QW682_08010 [Nitrososphaerota archaeon]
MQRAKDEREKGLKIVLHMKSLYSGITLLCYRVKGGKKMEEKKIRFFGEEGKKYIKLLGDGQEICCTEIDNAIIDYIEKIVKYYAGKFLGFQKPFCEIEKADDGVVGFYVDDEESDSNKYYVKIAKIGKHSIIYKLDFEKEDFKKMP